MEKSIIINAIYIILRDKLSVVKINAFSENAYLNEDLYLDSVLVLQLLINLELEFSINIPDSALSKDDFETVSSLSDFILNQYNEQILKQEALVSITNYNDENINTAVSQTEEFDDIKVHCFVSCICEIIKADPRVDHRILYFGVWDAEIVINENIFLNYHSDNINHHFLKDWYEELYGVTMISWYQDNLSKSENVTTLLKLLDNKTLTQHVMVMLDMFLLPERENKFNQNPFPHYVLLSNSNEESTLYMSDPDFRWEGLQNKQQVIQAISSDAVSGGYYFDSQTIRPTSSQSIYNYFLACFNPDKNPMTDSVRKIVTAHCTTTPSSQGIEISPLLLGQALTQLPVLAIRKYAYEHGLAFFWRELSLDDDEFESWCDVIETLVSTYKKIQFRAMKISQFYQDNHSVNQELVKEIYSLLDEQDQREWKIKRRLQEVFTMWYQKNPQITPINQYSTTTITR